MNADDPKLRYVTAVIEKPSSSAVEGIWAGYVVYERRLLGVAEGINREVVMRLLRRRVEMGDAPQVRTVPTYYNNVRRGKRPV